MPPLIILAGPTASGKSAAAIALAESLGTEIVSADSMQVYKYFDIGTAKPSPEARRAVVHHGIDILEPDGEFNAYEFKTLALRHARDLLGRGKIPVIVGGTGLYLKVFAEDFECAVQVSPEIRANIKSDIENRGILNMHAELSRIDPLSAKKIQPTDSLRIERALCVYRQTGIPLSSHHAGDSPTSREFEPHFFILQWERGQLYRSIDNRIDAMLRSGWVDEVKGLLGRGFDKRLKPFRSIGYAQLVNHLDGHMPLEQAVYEIKRETRHYAKRQITWFKKAPNGVALQVTPESTPASIRDKILSCLPCWAALVLATFILLTSFPARADESPAFKEGLRFLLQEDFNQAETRFAELRSSSSDPKERRRALYLMGASHAKRKEHDKAIETFKTALREFPEIEDYIRFDLARMYYESGQQPAALSEIDLLLKRFADFRFFPQTALMKAEILNGMGKTSEGSAFLSAAIERISKKGNIFKSALPELILKYAGLLEASGKSLAAYRQIEKLLVKYPVHPAAGKTDSILNRLKQKPGFVLPPMQPGERNERIQNLLSHARFEETVREIEQFRESGGVLNGQLYVYLARAYKGLGKREEAHKALSHFIRAFPKHPHLPEIKFMFARNLWNLNETGKSVEELQSLIKNHPADFWAAKGRFLLGRIYESIGKPDLAIEEFSRLETHSKDEELKEQAATRMGFILYLAKDYAKAAKQFEKNIRRSPHGRFVESHMFWLAKTQEKSGQDEMARKTYQDLYAAHPFNYYGAQAGLKLASQNTVAPGSSNNPATPFSLISEAPAAPDAKTDPSIKNRLLYDRAEEMIAMQLPENAHFEIRKIERSSQKNYHGIRRLASLYIKAEAYADAYRLLELYKNYKSKKHEMELPVEFWKMYYPLAYRESVETHAKTYNMDPLRIESVIRQESYFDKKSLSQAGAIGLMQIMPETGEKLALGNEYDLESTFDAESLFYPDTNILTGVKYLTELHSRYAGNWVYILICYNAGPAALEDWLRRFAHIDDMDVFVDSIPYPETRDFVRNVLRNYGVYRLLYAPSPAAATPAAN